MIEAIKVSRGLIRYNRITPQWTPAHQGFEGNEIADQFAKPATESACDAVQRGVLRETSLAFVSSCRSITKTRTADAARLISYHVRRKHRYRPPRARRIRKELRGERKALVGIYYQFLSGHATIGSYLHEKIHKVEPSACCWCGSAERGFWYHLIAKCKMWAP